MASPVTPAVPRGLRTAARKARPAHWLDGNYEGILETSPSHSSRPLVSLESLCLLCCYRARKVPFKLFLLHNAELFHLHNSPVYLTSEDVVADCVADWPACAGAGCGAGGFRSPAPRWAHCPRSFPSEARDSGGLPPQF